MTELQKFKIEFQPEVSNKEIHESKKRINSGDSFSTEHVDVDEAMLIEDEIKKHDNDVNFVLRQILQNRGAI